ncbi:MAG: acetate/propionate family kinase [Candidatus Eisenbacteria bacterium]
MNILVFDCEAYGIDYILWRASDDMVLARGAVTGVGTRSAILKHRLGAQSPQQLFAEKATCRDAIKWVISTLTDPKIGALGDESEIGAVGYRVTHGACKYTKPVLITSEVMDDIADFAEFAPKHNPYNLDGIRAARALLPGIPHVAVFDTSYYQTLEPKAYLYGLPYKYYSQHGVRKYGFHGPSHRYAAERACFLSGIPFSEARVVSMHLGRGSSVTATRAGKCVETSMGFSPLEGLVMETRCGDIDPEAVMYIMAKEELTLRTLSDVLNRRSGVLGLSGMGDFGEVIDKAKCGDERAVNALGLFVHSIRKYLGAYVLELGGTDIIVFTAFMAEGYPIVRQMVCEGLEFLGIKLDEEANSSVEYAEGEISAKDSKVKVYTIPHNEELIIAQRVYQHLS